MHSDQLGRSNELNQLLVRHCHLPLYTVLNVNTKCTVSDRLKSQQAANAQRLLEWLTGFKQEKRYYNLQTVMIEEYV